MKKIARIFAFLLIFPGGVARAIGYKAATGDAELNVMPGNLNLYARDDEEVVGWGKGEIYNV